MIYESRLELGWLLFADFAPEVRHIVAQPFLLKTDIDGKVRKHIPDYLLLTDARSTGHGRQASPPVEEAGGGLHVLLDTRGCHLAGLEVRGVERAGPSRAGEHQVPCRLLPRLAVRSGPGRRRPGGIQAYKFVLPAGSDAAEPDLRTHEGYDWVYVLNGTLRLVLGEHDLILKPGEAAEFDTRTPHWFGATGAGPVEYLSLMGKQGERAHVRAAPG
ncbi:cupin domain-containing protein [Streptomyces sp. NPDC087658]|uniref:cupin domain-containing protein n=1 Tax=Streptomyces sp. NPDC087658 TaxID=3365800 RepID=UPI0037FC641A